MSRGKRKRRADYALRMRFLKRTNRDRLIAELVEHCDVVHMDHLTLLVEAAESLARQFDDVGCGFRIVKD